MPEALKILNIHYVLKSEILRKFVDAYLLVLVEVLVSGSIYNYYYYDL